MIVLKIFGALVVVALVVVVVVAAFFTDYSK